MEAARVLIIDDDDLTLTILRKMLEADGYEVEVCSSGSEALARLLHASYDAILCDMWMSGMNGKDFYLQLKQGFPEYQRRVVFITGDIASEATWEFIDERHLPYVIKPISRPLLRRKLREIVGVSPVAQAQAGGKPAWDGVNRRRHRRVAINATARVRRKRWEVAAPDTASVVNASRGGIFLVTEREYRVGMEVLVVYPFTGYEDVEQEGYVVRVEERPDGKRGVAIALGEEAAAARDSFAGSEGDVRRHHIMRPAELPRIAAGDWASSRLAGEDDDVRRLVQELNEFRQTHDEVVEKRDRLASELAELRRILAEKESAQSAMSSQINELQQAMDTRNKELAEVEEVRHRALHDALTGIWNRGGIMDILKRELVRAQREGTFVGVLLGDLDHFKSVNDTFGHLAGDAVLQEAAQRITAAVRSYDFVGRYGGEEFLIILSSCENDLDMVEKANRIRSHVCSMPVSTAEGEIPITLSLGAASSAEFPEVEEILRAADAALYRAKRQGRNRVEVACAAEPQNV